MVGLQILSSRRPKFVGLNPSKAAEMGQDLDGGLGGSLPRQRRVQRWKVQTFLVEVNEALDWGHRVQLVICMTGAMGGAMH
jgi:hypothetical protein